MEIWKDIPGYEGSYAVSDLGRVKSFAKNPKGRILRPGPSNKFGHETVSLFRRNSLLVHRLVMLAFAGSCPDGHEVLHKNGRGYDNRLSNLSYGTRSENNRDIARHGKRKITLEQVEEIRRSNLKLKELSSIYGLALSSISSIRNRKYYRYV